MHRSEFHSVPARTHSFQLAPDAFAPGARKQAAKPMLKREQPAPAAEPEPQVQPKSEPPRRMEAQQQRATVEPKPVVAARETDRLEPGEIDAVPAPPVKPYARLRIVDPMAPDDPLPEPEPPPAPKRSEKIAAALKKFDVPAKTASLAKSSGSFASKQGGLILKSGKAVGRVMAMDTRALLSSAASNFKSWKRAKEDELERLERNAGRSVIANRFRRLAPLTAADVAVVETVNCAERKMHQAGSDIVIEGEGRTSPRLIASGWAARVRVLPNGRRQVLALLLPGDFIDMRPKGERRPANMITAMTVVETVDARRIVDAAGDANKYPGLAEALERIAAQEMSFADNQIVRLGVQGELRRVAHLLAELHWRLIPTGLASELLFPMPLTCETMADMLAMKPKRVRAVLEALRAKKMYSSRYCRATLLNATRAEMVSEFRAPEDPEVDPDAIAMKLAAE